MKNKKRNILVSAIMIIALCFSMIIGGTYAWFTDTASLAVNKIQAGKLDIALYYENDDGEWVDAEGKTLGWVQKVESDGTTISKIVEEEGLPLWEPGCTFILPKLKIVNEGNLALKYNVTIRGIKGSAKLNEVIEWTFTLDESEEELGKEHNLYPNGSANGASENIFTLSGHMLEEAGNEYQGLSIEGIGITVSATQLASEFDSHDNQYDKDAVLPVAAKAIGNLTVETDGSVVTTASEQVLSDSVMSVTYPAGVKLNKTESDVSGDEEKKTSAMQELAYVDDAPSASMAGISIDSGKAVAQYDLTLPVSDENDVLVTTTIKYVQGLTGVEVYHSGVKLPNEAEAGEYFTYDSESGVLTLYLYHASPIDIVSDKPVTVTTADELKKAIDNENVSLIKLGADIACPEVDPSDPRATAAISVLRDVTIDFNGHVLGIALENGTIKHGGPTANVILKDSSKNEKAGLTSKIVVFKNGGFQQFAAVMAWQGTTTINSGYYSHDNVVVGSQLQASSQQNGLIINGGTFEGKGAASTIYNCFGTIIVNDGIFSSQTEDGCGDCICVDSGSSYMGSLTYIYGGKFTSASRMIYVDVNEKYDQKVYISGGDFTVDGKDLVVFSEDVDNVKEYIIITGGTFNVDPSDYVAEGYKAVEKDGIWTVVKVEA